MPCSNQLSYVAICGAHYPHQGFICQTEILFFIKCLLGHAETMAAGRWLVGFADAGAARSWVRDFIRWHSQKPSVAH